MTTLPPTRFYRFYFKGEISKALAHAESERADLGAAGHPTSWDIWITDLSIWHNKPWSIGECWIAAQ